MGTVACSNSKSLFGSVDVSNMFEVHVSNAPAQLLLMGLTPTHEAQVYQLATAALADWHVQQGDLHVCPSQSLGLIHVWHPVQAMGCVMVQPSWCLGDSSWHTHSNCKTSRAGW
jgi:hypothetical protein